MFFEFFRGEKEKKGVLRALLGKGVISSSSHFEREEEDYWRGFFSFLGRRVSSAEAEKYETSDGGGGQKLSVSPSPKIGGKQRKREKNYKGTVFEFSGENVVQ